MTNDLQLQRLTPGSPLCQKHNLFLRVKNLARRLNRLPGLDPDKQGNP